MITKTIKITKLQMWDFRLTKFYLDVTYVTNHLYLYCDVITLFVNMAKNSKIVYRQYFLGKF